MKSYGYFLCGFFIGIIVNNFLKKRDDEIQWKGIQDIINKQQYT